MMKLFRGTLVLGSGEAAAVSEARRPNTQGLPCLSMHWIVMGISLLNNPLSGAIWIAHSSVRENGFMCLPS